MSSYFVEVKPSLKEFLRLAESYTLIPVYVEIPADLETPISLFYKVFKNQDYIFLLESLEGTEKWARYSFLGLDPFFILKSSKDEALFNWKYLKEFIYQYSIPSIKDLPRFWGGAVGFVSYEMVHFFEPRVPISENFLEFHFFHFLFPEVLIIYDRLLHTIKLVCLARKEEGFSKELYLNKKEKLLSLLNHLKKTNFTIEAIKKKLFFEPEIERETFLEMVKRAKEYISQGDVIQVVLSQRFRLEDEILENPQVPFLLYRALRKVNPSPYMFFLKLEDEILIGSSPEILVRLENNLVETRPIAGTRPRGRTEEEDKALEEELKKDEKELAEHIMLVDLGRNDLGKICKYGSVEVYELMVIEKYSHVMHLVSGVRGSLVPGKDMFEVFAATFPAGTVSGAPKIRAMEIIAELEKTNRGPYAGAVGYFGFSQNMDFCITIRTLFQKGKTLYLQAGAGIVADSVPEREYQETISKAQGMKRALELFGKGYFL